jgi:hypothetical protein
MSQEITRLNRRSGEKEAAQIFSNRRAKGQEAAQVFNRRAKFRRPLTFSSRRPKGQEAPQALFGR